MLLKVSREAAVDHGYYWQPMSTCPTGVKVQLLNPAGVAVYGVYNGRPDAGWLGWCPLPKVWRDKT